MLTLFHRGPAQELYKSELADNFEQYFEQKLKDAGSKAVLKLKFMDWNYADTAPCSADAAKERHFQYFTKACDPFWEEFNSCRN